MKNLISIFILFISGMGYSQSFKPVTINSKVTLYCDENFDGIVKGMRVDTIIKDGKLEIINFHKEFNNDFDCVRPISASWIGEKCLIDTALQIAYFFNEINDTIVLDYLMQIGEMWDFYKKNKIIIKARVIAINIEKLANGKEDIVKSVQLFKFNLAGKDEWESYKPILKISKNHGLTQTINLLNVPYLSINNSDKLSLFKSIPVRNIHLSDIYNFNVGDVFEFEINDLSGPDDYRLMEILGKVSPTKYLIKNTFQNVTYISPKVFYNVSSWIDTFSIKKDNLILDPYKILPYETYMNGIAASYNFVNYFEDSYLFPDGKGGGYTQPLKDTCWPRSMVVIVGGPYEYREGYGHTKSFFIKDPGIYELHEQMIYSKKGNKIEGTFRPLGVDEFVNKTKFSIFPNPASKTVFISSGNLKIEAYSVCSTNGQILICNMDYNKTEGINISNLADGLYFINMQSAEGNSTLRFLKTENK